MKLYSEMTGEEVFADIDRRYKERAEKMPDEQSALNQMFEAFIRLKDLGWNDAIYCPKDGTLFSVIEAGSTGTHTAHYSGEWPKGHYWVHGDGDLWPSRPILFKLQESKDG